jgi:hypothetical protein
MWGGIASTTGERQGDHHRCPLPWLVRIYASIRFTLRKSILLRLLDMMRVCANRDVRLTKKAVLNHFRDFETIEVLLSHLQKYSLQCFLDIAGRERTENRCLRFLSLEGTVPSDAAELLVEDLEHYPLR